ncbi:MAG: hypothetical protein AAGA54_17925 [Myxococcota bacterium]
MTAHHPIIKRLSRAAASDRLGMLDVATLPALACDAMLLGVEADAIAQLAGESPHTHPAELRDLFSEVLQALEIGPFSRLEAAEFLKRVLARDVVDGAIAARDGAGQIVALEREVGDETPTGPYAGSGFGIAELLGLYYAFDDIESLQGARKARHVAEIETEIVDACRRIAAGATA